MKINIYINLYKYKIKTNYHANNNKRREAEPATIETPLGNSDPGQHDP